MPALFLVPSPHEPHLPPMDQLQYTDPAGNLAGGYWIIGEAPSLNTVILCIDTTDAMLNQLSENPDFFYLGDYAEVTNGTD